MNGSASPLDQGTARIDPATPAARDHRLAICNGCEYLRTDRRCSHNGHRVDEPKPASESCPLQKWTPHSHLHPLPRQPLKWAIGVTTAPRPISTLARSLKSLESAGFGNLTIFAEPKSQIPEPWQNRTVVRPEKLGCWRNYIQTLRGLLERHPEADTIAVFQDDIVIARETRAFLEHDLWASDKTGVLSLYSPETYESPGKVRWIRKRTSWLPGAQALVYPRHVVELMVSERHASDWRGSSKKKPVQKCPHKKKHADAWIGHVLAAEELEVYYPTGSLVQHIATSSSVGHGGNSSVRRGKHFRQSAAFVGEETSPFEVCSHPPWRWNNDGTKRQPGAILSVCVSLKNRSRVTDTSQTLELFPRFVESLRVAAKEVGPLELVVADFYSDDWPLSNWIQGDSSLRVKTVCVGGDFSRGKGLNIAAKAASSNNLFLCDADLLIDAAAIRRGLEAIHNGPGARFPVVRNINQNGTPGIWRVHGEGMAFLTRQIFDAVGGVPEKNKWGGEDNEFANKVRRHLGLREIKANDRGTVLRDPGLRHQWHPDKLRHIHYAGSTGLAQNSYAPNKTVQSLLAEFGPLGQHLSSIGPFQYIDLGGNRGDLVIRAGVLAYFRELGLEWIETTAEGANSALPAVLSGSGGWCRYWGRAAGAASVLADKCPQLLVLPSTFEREQANLIEGKKNVTLFVRERESLRLLPPGTEAIYCPDMSLWADLSTAIEPLESTGWSFREDSEGLGVRPGPVTNLDLSIQKPHTAEAFIRHVSRYEEVHTDRAHVAIVGAMLGRQVRLYAGGYHKNRAFFDAWLNRFANCEWRD